MCHFKVRKMVIQTEILYHLIFLISPSQRNVHRYQRVENDIFRKNARITRIQDSWHLAYSSNN